MRRRLYLVLVGLLGAAVATLPSLAAGSTAASSGSFTAVDFAWQGNGGPGNAVTIAQGGTVSFGYPTGSSAHNADFGSGAQPSSCVQTAGPSSGSVPPVPNQPSAPGWSGTCTFNTPGTYTFHCHLHAFMTGTIVVQGAGTTTTTTTTTNPPPPSTSTSTTTTTGTSTTTATTQTNSQPASTAPGGPSATSIPGQQRGGHIKGTVRTTAATDGGWLEVDLLAPASSLRLRGQGLVRVGRLVRHDLHAGALRFTVALVPRGTRALRRRGALTLTVVVTIHSPHGETFSSQRHVSDRR